MGEYGAVEAVVYGTVCLDRFVFVGEDGEVPPDAPVTELPGGEAFNTAAALAGWGVCVLLTGTALGTDEESARLRRLLHTSPLAAGIDLSLLPDALPDAVTPVCTVRVLPDGERRMRGRGYDRAVAPPPLPDALLAACPLFIVDPNLGVAAVRQTLAARAAGCEVVAMDCEGVPAVIAAGPRVSLSSAERLAREVDTPPDSAAVARSLRAAGARTAVVTRGAAGGVVADRDAGEFAYPAASIPGDGRAVDTTGAGDTFRAGIAYGLLRGLSLSETLRFAAAAAALHGTVVGGASRFPLADVRALVAV